MKYLLSLVIILGIVSAIFAANYNNYGYWDCERLVWSKMYEAGNNLLVVYFTAPWCAACQVIARRIPEIKAEYPQIIFHKVDVDDCQDLSVSWYVDRLPTFVFIRRGTELARMNDSNFNRLKELVKRFS